MRLIIHISFLVDEIDLILKKQANNLGFLLPSFKLFFDYFHSDTFTNDQQINKYVKNYIILPFLKGLFHNSNETFKLLVLNQIIQRVFNNDFNIPEKIDNYYNYDIEELIIHLIIDICTIDQQKSFIQTFQNMINIQNFIFLIFWFKNIIKTENLYNNLSTIYRQIDMSGEKIML